MAEIADDDTPQPPPPFAAGESSKGLSTPPIATDGNKPPEHIRKPGTKRLILTASVLLYFLLGLPFLLKSTEIHHSPLPSNAIATLSRRLHSNPPSFPCGHHVVFLHFGPNPGPSGASLVDHLGQAISTQLLRLPAPSTTGNLYISVTVESMGGCSSSSSSVASHWRCRAMTTTDLVCGDEVFDELLHSALGGGSGDRMKVYTVVVVESGDGKGRRVVIGKHRHAWVVRKVDGAEATSVIGKVFVKYFMNGGIKDGEVGIGKGVFMPVGLDGNVVKL